MRPIAPSGYRFVSPAHWQTCLLAQATATGGVIRPLAPFAPPAEPVHRSVGAFAPAAAQTRELAWRDAAGWLHRALPDDELVEEIEAPGAIATSQRLVAIAADYWTAGQGHRTVEVFDTATLSRRFVVGFSGARVIDLAASGRGGGVAVLVVRDAVVRVVQVDGTGHADAGVVLCGLDDAMGFAAFAPTAGCVVLAADRRRLLAFAAEGGEARWRVALPTLAPYFSADAIGGDARTRVFVAGRDGALAGEAGDGTSHVLVFDLDGVRIDDVALPEAATGLVGSRDGAWVTGARGLYRLRESAAVPDSRDEIRGDLLTPLLEAPDVPDGRRWLRVECRGDLPAGATLEIACVSTDDYDVCQKVRELTGQAARPPSQRVQAIRAVAGLTWRPMVFHGTGTAAAVGGLLSAAPLHDVHDRFVWICLSLSAGAGATLPSVVEMAVLYPGRTLMEQLPAIYQRDESRPGSFLRGLVGVLETTTQDLDARLAGLGARIHPDTASGQWIDGVARWLGLPWDDALDPVQKHALMARAEAIARGRGTRAGLGELLDAIVAESSARWRVRDLTVDHGMAVVGGARCDGSVLPALLGGAPRSSARLDVGATLGRLRLSCDGAAEDETGTRFLGRIQVSVAADATAAARWAPWLARLLQEMLPVGTTLALRWLRAGALDVDADDGVVTLQDAPDSRLGSGAAIGVSRLRGDIASLPATSDRFGPNLH
jgi:phage tail-like protein